jgi:hypothetical protein
MMMSKFEKGGLQAKRLFPAVASGGAFNPGNSSALLWNSTCLICHWLSLIGEIIDSGQVSHPRGNSH